MNAADQFNLDYGRDKRQGIGEAIFCAQKSVAQINAALEMVVARRHPMLLTHLNVDSHAELTADLRDMLDYDPVSRTAFLRFDTECDEPVRDMVAVVAAGTSDAGPAMEAVRTLNFNGVDPTVIFDVGVAGLWRLLDRVDDLSRHPIIIAVAGMDAALPTVVGGLVPGAVIAVPTSTGYGAARGGDTALHACLSSCASGVVVCNIDNGYGAACAALRILKASRQIPS
ncbi:hypothetical protein CLV78_111126 [Aliiruegeria haliotis]|uniref:PurE domain-containing protein n=1 Tax=Aliiruegeria haliotis TaxID=1280846 RepID=A0A2T0RIL6_9RHOB|nr:nickel pincer cofactor biosynthesis protein LarB [Aliiruegeria haliotis]PRY20971.1 hypothetical protein CLV78_111126 [Aliiruegeria haliotis]